MAYTLSKNNNHVSHKKLYFLSKSDTGTVYRCNNKAFHIFPDNIKGVFSEQDGIYMSKIDTHRILLPENILYKNRRMVGFTTPLIKNGKNSRIIDSDKNTFLYNLEMLEDDVDLLSRSKILLSGLVQDKSLYNGELYLLDPSKYGRINVDEDTLLKLNLFQLHLLLSRLVVNDLKKDLKYGEDIRGVEALLKLREEDEYPSSFFNKILGEKDKVKELIKKI